MSMKQRSLCINDVTSDFELRDEMNTNQQCCLNQHQLPPQSGETLTLSALYHIFRDMTMKKFESIIIMLRNHVGFTSSRELMRSYRNILFVIFHILGSKKNISRNSPSIRIFLRNITRLPIQSRTPMMYKKIFMQMYNCNFINT